MKKTLSILLSVLVIFALAACGGNKDTTSSLPATESEKTESITSSEVSSVESTVSNVSSKDSSSNKPISSQNVTTSTPKTETPSVITQFDDEFLTFRTGLSNTYAKLTGENKLTVAYIGGSITSGASANDPNTGSWRPLVTSWLKEKFPAAAITEVNTAVGSSGSMLPVFYMDQRVVPHKPDLVFLELAINDHLAAYSESQVMMQYETIIRKLLVANPYCEFVAVYTTNDVVSATDKFFPQAAAQDAVAAHYGIASINVGKRLRVERGLINPKGPSGEYTNKWKAFFSDSVHPNDKGHQAYASYVKEFLAKAFGVAAKLNAAKSEKTLPAQKSASLMMNTTWCETTDFDLSASKGWSHAGADSKFSALGVKNYIVTDTADNELVFNFSGSNLYLFSSVVPYDGTASLYQYSIDGGAWTAMSPCGAHPTKVVTGLPAGNHTVRFRAGGAGENAKSATYQKFQVGAFLSW